MANKIYVAVGYRHVKQLCLIAVQSEKDIKDAEKQAMKLLSTVCDRDSKIVKVVKEEVFMDGEQELDEIHELQLNDPIKDKPAKARIWKRKPAKKKKSSSTHNWDFEPEEGCYNR